ncbi:hypothetical protein [Tissierella praeacuta]|uniref:hypothetical protein n=1 Tax=Tissierella praeacuta TaxID=43131 RepID=UPI0028ABAAE6|nr:hypothetical protein [Tissierella praeacuta]
METQNIRKTNLWNVIHPYANWFNNRGEEVNREARLALYEFYKELLNYEPSKEYERKHLEHMYYIRFLVEIKKAFKEEKYERACNELISLMYYEPFFQGRIYFNLIYLLRKELGIEGD